MCFTVEPVDGPELDRLITALLNVTGAIHQVIEDELHTPGLDGLAIVGHVADCLHTMLALFAEHNTDEELAGITQFLAVAALTIAREGGFDDVFYEAET